MTVDRLAPLPTQAAPEKSHLVWLVEKALAPKPARAVAGLALARAPPVARPALVARPTRAALAFRETSATALVPAPRGAQAPPAARAVAARAPVVARRPMAGPVRPWARFRGAALRGSKGKVCLAAGWVRLATLAARTHCQAWAEPEAVPLVRRDRLALAQTAPQEAHNRL